MAGTALNRRRARADRLARKPPTSRETRSTKEVKQKSSALSASEKYRGRNSNARSVSRLSAETFGPDHQFRAGFAMVRARTFSSHNGPCGQPAGLGGVARFRPLPPHAGHLTRINAMPSDLPLMSTGFATYPVPPQSGQLSGPIAPLMWLDFPRPFAESCNKLVHVTNYEQTLANPANRYC
jgi:hypothetical protein